MKGFIKINSANEVNEFCAGDCILAGGIEADIPQGVLADNPLSYKYIDGDFIKNPDYKPPEPPPAPIAPDAVAMAVAELAAQVEANQLANQLAIAELAAVATGGGASNG